MRFLIALILLIIVLGQNSQPAKNEGQPAK